MTKISVDIGGTFTDLVVRDGDGEIRTYKSPTTPDDHSRGIEDVLELGGIDLSHVDAFTHGTTVALNAMLEGRGAKTGLITTAGFRDVLELMRTARPHQFDMNADKPAPLVPRRLRLEANERVSSDGELLVAVDRGEILRLAEELIGEGCQSIAICFLFAFKEPANEEAAEAAIRAAHPGVSVSRSSEITREWREFERTSTTVINALCRPAVERYVNNLGSKAEDAGFANEVRYMQSNGGLMSAEEASRFPVRTILSGPVGGVIAAERLAAAIGVPNLLTLDIGGTSADVSLLTDGEIGYQATKEIERWPILFPAVDIHAVGTGGGSMAVVDQFGALKVGPQSAGANPGPVAYGRGGEVPTVTDAHVALGTIDPDYFLGGALTLDKDGAVTAIREQIAEPLGLETMDAAHGIIEISNVTMAGALREISVNQGHDPRDFALAAFGGAGGLHAAALCRELQIPRLIVPVSPAVFSAVGMQAAELKHDFSRTVLVAASSASAAALAEQLVELQEECHAKLDPTGTDRDGRRAIWTAELRYEGQDHLLSIPVTGKGSGLDIERAVRDFGAHHKRTYGYEMPDEVIFVNLRATVVATTDPPAPTLHLATGGEALKSRRPIYLGRELGVVEVPIYDRTHLAADEPISGPAIIVELQSTVLIHPDDTLVADRFGNLIVTIGG